ncbi:ferric reductase-like transmembrane domain-containing protein [Patescibacteria group bacterium]
MKLSKYKILLLLVIANVPFVLAAIDYSIKFGSSSVEHATFITANLLGLIGTTLLMFQFLLGFRFVSSRFTRDLVWSLKVHKIIGIYGVLLLFIHPLAQMFSYSADVFFLFGFDFSTNFARQIGLGRLAFVFLLVIWMTSAVVRGKIKYRPWKYIHYLAYPALALGLIHAKNIGTLITSYPLLETYWNGYVLLFFLFVLARVMTYANYGRHRYKLSKKKLLVNNVYNILLTPAGVRLKPKPGQFVYLRFSKYGESHPFTVMRHDDKTGTLEFGIKIIGKFTKEVKNLKKGHVIYIDGPYGVFTQEGQSDDPKILIAGGVGITPFVELIDKFSNKKTHLLYSNKKLKGAVYRNRWKKKLGNNYYDFVTGENASGKSIFKGIINASKIQKILGKRIINSSKFFVCGSPDFTKSMLSELDKLGIEKEYIFFEEFGF